MEENNNKQFPTERKIRNKKQDVNVNFFLTTRFLQKEKNKK